MKVKILENRCGFKIPKSVEKGLAEHVLTKYKRWELPKDSKYELKDGVLTKKE